MRNMMIRKLLYISSLVISMALLTSCGSDGIGGTGSPVDAGISGELSPTFKQISRIDIPLKDQGYSNFKTTIISSQTELDQFITTVKGQNNWDNKPDFLKKMQSEKHDFSKNNILLYRMTESSDSIKLTPKEPVIKDNKIIIAIARHNAQQRKIQSPSYAPVYRTLGKTGIINYALAYKVIKTVKEVIIINGTEETTVKLINQKSNEANLTKQQKSSLSSFFNKGTTVFTGVIVDKDGSNDLSIGDIAKLTIGGVAGNSLLDYVITAKDFENIQKQDLERYILNK